MPDPFDHGVGDDRVDLAARMERMLDLDLNTLGGGPAWGHRQPIAVPDARPSVI
ncbi:MAG: hypothetical protein IPF99_13220 [Deltaproteobacteria bacterium]|nr:hypothetical protein [Deltaproteobacteria bacterium]